MGLCAFDDPEPPEHPDAASNISSSTQNPDGSWTEHETTGTGFPKVFYLKYDMYRNSWPLLALATYRRLMTARQTEANGSVHGMEHSIETIESGALPLLKPAVKLAGEPHA